MSIEPRDEAPPPRDRAAGDGFVGVAGPIADATDAPEPVGIRPTAPPASERARPLPPGKTPDPPRRADGIADLETPIFVPRRPPTESLPGDDEPTIPVLPPEPGDAKPPTAPPAVERGWTAPPSPARPPAATRPAGAPPNLVVAGILTVAIVLATFLVVGAFGGGSLAGRSPPPPPLVAPGTPGDHAAAPAPPDPASPVDPAPSEPAPADEAPAAEDPRRAKKRSPGKKKEP